MGWLKNLFKRPDKDRIDNLIDAVHRNYTAAPSIFSDPKPLRKSHSSDGRQPRKFHLSLVYPDNCGGGGQMPSPPLKRADQIISDPLHPLSPLWIGAAAGDTGSGHGRPISHGGGYEYPSADAGGDGGSFEISCDPAP